jgi:multiple sugar transport system substrate-binding protein
MTICGSIRTSYGRREANGDPIGYLVTSSSFGICGVPSALPQLPRGPLNGSGRVKNDERYPPGAVWGGVWVAESGTSEGAPGRPTESYRPPSGRNKLLLTIVALLVVSNLVTGVTVFFVAQPAPTPVQLCASGSGSSAAPPASGAPSYARIDPDSSRFTFRTGPRAEPQQAPLKVIGPWAGPEAEPFLRVLENFTIVTGIQVEYQNIRQEDLRTILPNDFAASRATGDVVFMVSSFIKANGAAHMVELGGNITEANYVPGSLDPVKVGTDAYGGVYTGKVKPGFWYRKSFFQANNLTVPTTFDQFRDLVVKISKIDNIRTAIVSGDGVGWPLSDLAEHYLATYGGASMHRDLMAKTKAWTASDVRAVFADRLVPMLAGGCFSEPLAWNTVALTNWWEGLHGLYFMGSWITGLVANATDLGVFPLPPQTGTTRGVVFAGDYFFIPRYTANLAEAQQLAEWLAGRDGQTYQVRQGGHIATALGVPLIEYPAVDREVAQRMQGVEILSDLDDVIGGEFQTTLWSQLQLLWVSPDQLDAVLAAIQAKVPA